MLNYLESYETYLQYVSYCAMLGVRVAYNYMNLKQKILENHTRVISYSNNGMYWYSYIDNKKKICCKTREGLEDKLVEWYVQNGAGIFTLRSLLERALVFNREHDFLAASTVDRYQADFDKHISSSVLADADIRSITEMDINKYFNEFMLKRPSSKVLSNVKTVFRLIYAYARIQESVECLHINSVFANLQFPRRAFKEKSIPEDRVFKDDHIDIIMSALDCEKRIDLGIKFCFYTGLRVGELCALRKCDFDFDNHFFWIQRAETVSGKGKGRVYCDTLPKCQKKRKVVMSDKAMDVAKVLFYSTDDYLFFNGTGGHIHVRSFDSRLRRLCRNSDIPVFSMHDIRRTFGSYMLDSGVPESFVQEQMGHSDIRTTREYYYYSTKKHDDYIRYANQACI